MAVAYRNLYEKICTYENLFLAFKKAARGKRGLPSVESPAQPGLGRVAAQLFSLSFQERAGERSPGAGTKPCSSDFPSNFLEHIHE